MKAKTPVKEAENAVKELVKCFSTDAGRKDRGLRKMLRAINEDSPALIQNWESTGRIPHYREAQIRQAVADSGVAVPPELWARLFPARERSAA